MAAQNYMGQPMELLIQQFQSLDAVSLAQARATDRRSKDAADYVINQRHLQQFGPTNKSIALKLKDLRTEDVFNKIARKAQHNRPHTDIPGKLHSYSRLFMDPNDTSWNYYIDHPLGQAMPVAQKAQHIRECFEIYNNLSLLFEEDEKSLQKRLLVQLNILHNNGTFTIRDIEEHFDIDREMLEAAADLDVDRLPLWYGMQQYFRHMGVARGVKNIRPLFNLGRNHFRYFDDLEEYVWLLLDTTRELTVNTITPGEAMFLEKLVGNMQLHELGFGRA